MGSHRQPTQCDSEPTEVFDNRHLPGIQLLWPTLADRQDLVRIEGVRGSNPLSSTRVMSQDIEDTLNPLRVRGVFGWPAGWLASGW